MSLKNQTRKVYHTANGKQVDLDSLRKKNELTPVVGNVRANARGDLLDPNGKIIKNKENS